MSAQQDQAGEHPESGFSFGCRRGFWIVKCIKRYYNGRDCYKWKFTKKLYNKSGLIQITDIDTGKIFDCLLDGTNKRLSDFENCESKKKFFQTAIKNGFFVSVLASTVNVILNQDGKQDGYLVFPCLCALRNDETLYIVCKEVNDGQAQCQWSFEACVPKSEMPQSFGIGNGKDEENARNGFWAALCERVPVAGKPPPFQHGYTFDNTGLNQILDKYFDNVKDTSGNAIRDRRKAKAKEEIEKEMGNFVARQGKGERFRDVQLRRGRSELLYETLGCCDQFETDGFVDRITFVIQRNDKRDNEKGTYSVGQAFTPYVCQQNAGLNYPEEWFRVITDCDRFWQETVTNGARSFWSLLIEERPSQVYQSLKRYQEKESEAKQEKEETKENDTKEEKCNAPNEQMTEKRGSGGKTGAAPKSNEKQEHQRIKANGEKQAMADKATKTPKATKKSTLNPNAPKFKPKVKLKSIKEDKAFKKEKLLFVSSIARDDIIAGEYDDEQGQTSIVARQPLL